MSIIRTRTISSPLPQGPWRTSRQFSHCAPRCNGAVPLRRRCPAPDRFGGGGTLRCSRMQANACRWRAPSRAARLRPRSPVFIPPAMTCFPRRIQATRPFTPGGLRRAGRDRPEAPIGRRGSPTVWPWPMSCNFRQKRNLRPDIWRGGARLRLAESHSPSAPRPRGVGNRGPQARTGPSRPAAPSGRRPRGQVLY